MSDFSPSPILARAEKGRVEDAGPTPIAGGTYHTYRSEGSFLASVLHPISSSDSRS